MRICTPEVILKMNHVDFVNLFRVIKEQSRMYHAKHKLKREYPASKNHAYDKWTTLVYEKRGESYELIRGKEYVQQKVNLNVGSSYYIELKDNEYQFNRNIKLDNNNIRHLKDRYCDRSNKGTDFKEYEYDFVSEIRKKEFNVNVSMNMLDESQFSLTDSSKNQDLSPNYGNQKIPNSVLSYRKKLLIHVKT